jgi:hypothetical protein
MRNKLCEKKFALLERTLAGLGVAFLLSLGASLPVTADTYTVVMPNGVDTANNDPGDYGDQVPGDGTAEIYFGSGYTSLRSAIEEANQLPGHDTIIIALDTLQLRTELPPLTDPAGVTILSAGTAKFVLDGSTVNSRLAALIGLLSSQFATLDTNTSGTLSLGECQGIPYVENIFPILHNLSGVRQVDFNIIDSDGDHQLTPEELADYKAHEAGLRIESPNNIIMNIAIVNFPTNGIVMDMPEAHDNIIQGCYIGNTGASDGGNKEHGILLGNGAQDNLIGGTTAETRNIISGNGTNEVETNEAGDVIGPLHLGHGILITDPGTTNNEIIGNYIGTDVTGLASISNAFSGIVIRSGASGNFIGGPGEGEGNVITGNGDPSNGCPENCGNGAANQYGNGIYIIGDDVGGESSTDNIIQGNLVGRAADGSTLRNATAGIRLDGTDGNLIGGTEEGAGNIITGHSATFFTSGGIALRSTFRTRVEGNTSIGNETGITLGNCVEAVIGSPGAGNVLSANTDGVGISGGRDNVFHGNFIGTDSTGTGAVGNSWSGFYVSGIQENLQIGGSGSGEGNVFAANRQSGLIVSNIEPISAEGEPAIFVQGNVFGTTVSGTSALPNGLMGILLDDKARNVQVGGTGAGEGNVISGNTSDGIRIARSPDSNGAPNYIQVFGNKIGTDKTGTIVIPNGGSGVSIYEGGNQIDIGGTAPGEANLIRGNSLYGVRVKGGSLEVTHENTIRGNSIYANGTSGIHLEDGANDGLAAPTITLLGPVRGIAPPNATVDLYADGGSQGRFYLGTGTADGTGAYSVIADLSGLVVRNLTATATNAGGSTSEFSAPFPIVPPSIVTQPVGLVIVEGETFELSVEAAGSDPLSYQWEFLPADGGEFENVVNSGIFNGATTNNLGNTGARLTDAGSYRCVVTNAVDTVTTSVVTVTVVAANTDTAEVSTLQDTLDANTSSPAHLIAYPGADGVVSLREAILAANNRAGADSITFNSAGTIVLGQGLPSLSDANGGTTIDGGGDITINGQNLGSSVVGLQVDTGSNALRGLTLINFPGNGVTISGATATGNTVTGCRIGTNGTSLAGNGGHGIEISGGASFNLIGGSEVDSRNIISGNDRSGVYVTDGGTANNRVLGNYIGTSANGLAAIANGESGIAFVDGAAGNFAGDEVEGEGNVVSANNGAGILISGVGTTQNTVAGNVIGLNATADNGLGNVRQGVALLDGASGNLIGGVTSDAANLIGGNAGAAVLVDGAATIDNTIRLNSITGNFSGGIVLDNGGNTALAAPVISDIDPVSGTTLPGATVDIYSSTDRQGATHLATVIADGQGNYSTPVALEPLIGLYLTATATDGTGNTSAFSDGFFIDLEPPVITLLGATPLTIQCGTVYADAGATAQDDVDGNITNDIEKTILFEGDPVNAVSTSVLGTYTITYNVSDNAGQVAIPVTRTVEVVDTEVPVITLNGSAALLIECGGSYTEVGATATDGCDGALEVSITGTVNTAEPDVYVLVYRATDSHGNAAVDVTRTVRVADTALPEITVLGDLAITLECGDPYLDAGATVTDVCDSTVELVTDNPVEPGVPGVYTVLYDATDASGNEAAQAFRTITVVDTTPPVITLLGSADLTVECGVPYNEPGADVTDTCENNLEFLVTGTVNTSAPGNYTLVYSASDSAGNVADTVTRTVRVADNAIPVIALTGPSTVNVECGGTYTELGATASDNCEGNLNDAVVISGTVNTTVAGSYTVNYDAADSVGNRAVRVTRTVVVAVCPAPCEDQCAGDPDNAVDEDGDGLSACIESCLGTSDTLIDSDGDGVPDNIEMENGTDPVLPDSGLDLDGDGLTELEEFIFDSDPLDPNSPSISFFVSSAGANSVGGGSSDSPWATISYAIAQSGASAVNPVRIIIADGNYPEDVTLIPYVTLVGAVGVLPRIEGTVVGADHSGLVNLEIAAFTGDEVMLVMDDVAMVLENVVFRGSAARPAAGILADGPRSAASIIDGCLFTSVSIGIDVGGSLPIIRRCTFEDTTIAGVFVRSTATIGDGASLGDVDDPSTGSNLFSGITQGRAVINELTVTLLAQQNEWGTTDLNAIQRNLVSGPVTVAPVLPTGSASDTASLYITVWRASNQSRISSASVTATTEDGASVTVETNRNGVYALPLLRSGTYSVEVSATGFESQTIPVTLDPGELGSQVVALAVPIDKAGGPSCHGTPGTSLGMGISDLLVSALLLGALLVGAFVPAMRRRMSS